MNINDEQLEALLASWSKREADLLSYAEEAFFANKGESSEKERHMAACARFTNYAIQELKAIIDPFKASNNA